jgi:hypothetical protein
MRLFQEWTFVGTTVLVTAARLLLELPASALGAERDRA